MHCSVRCMWLLIVLSAASSSPAAEPAAGTLRSRLMAEGIDALAEAAETQGDAQRGAVAFFQPTMACSRCHSTSGKAEGIGPDLTQWRERPTTAHLVESMLDPSKQIREGYETAAVLDSDGRLVTGLLVRADETGVTLRDPNTGKMVFTPMSEIDEWTKRTESAMPADAVNQLGTRQQFLDLVRYVREVADGGPARARELQPPAALLTARPLPDYEADIDHAGLIRSLGDDAFERGQAIYERLCANCHGTPDQPGTLPTSRKFHSEPLRNGSDPYSMYQTLTRGFGMMVPQHWMVPRQKYDVIHFIREAYLRPHNPSQYFEVTDGYLAGVPSGTTFGPEPSSIEPWSAMDYGPSLVNTYEFGRDGRNIAYKGIAVQLDGSPGGVSRGRAWAVFEHDTLRLAGFWTGEGFIDWNGIHFNGRHAIHPRVVGDVHVENIGPGWADPATGSFADTRRVTGRDGRRYGPLPRDWGRLEGIYQYGPQTIVRYRVGTAAVLEMPGMLDVADGSGDGTIPVLTRSLEIGPRETELLMAVAGHPDEASRLQRHDGYVTFGPPDRDAAASTDPPVQFDGQTFLEVADGAAFDTTKSFTIAARMRTRSGGTIVARTTPGPKWVPGGQVLFVRGGRLCYDIGWVGVVQSNVRVNDGRWHDVAVTFDEKTGVARLIVDGRPAGQKVMRPKAELQQPVFRIGYCAPNFPSPTAFEGEIEFVRVYDRALDVDEFGREEAEAARPVARWDLTEPARGGTIPNAASPNAEGDGLAARVTQSASGGSARRADGTVVAGVAGTVDSVAWKQVEGRLCLVIPPGDETLRLVVWTGAVESSDQAASLAQAKTFAELRPAELSAMTQGGPPRWLQRITTRIEAGPADGPFAVDVLTVPESNPWLARVRPTGFDFFEGSDRAAVCAWDGDVWLVEGLQSGDGTLTWRRIASGLFQPLGLKIVDGVIYVTCRDQLVILRDLNGDGETDFYETFNSDHQVTEHFHEFAMGLQRDAEGNFYYAKSARHALPAIVPHHGTLLRVSPDGTRTEILATGFRAANGVCVNPDGTFFVTDQEGHWTPKNRINWVRPGGFYGNMMGYHDVDDPSDDAMQPPLCWITNAFDRSPAELLWVNSPQWGELDGRLLNLSYGYGKVYVVAYETVQTDAGELMQGGMTALPLESFPTGLTRGRCSPDDGQLYVCGMFAWAGNQQQPGGFYRIRRTDRPVHVPVEFHARRGELELGFTGQLNASSATDPENYTVRVWSLQRSARYGSKHIDEQGLDVTGVRLKEDGRTIVLEVPELAPTMGLAVRWQIESAEGSEVSGELHGTIHALGKR